MHERLRALADELERSAGPDDVNGTADDNPEDAGLDGDGDGAPDGGADLDADGQPDPTGAKPPAGGAPVPGKQPTAGQPPADGDNDPDDGAMPPGDGSQPPADGAAPGGDDAPGYGPHNVEAGHHVAFSAGEFNGAGKVTATGDDGCTVQDKTGREHRVHWHEVKGHNDGAAKAGAQPPGKPGQPPAHKPPPKPGQPPTA